MRSPLIAAALSLSVLATPAHADPVPLTTLLKEIKVALLKVQDSEDSDALPTLESVTLNAATTQKKDIGGTFKLLIIEFGKKRTSELTTNVSIKLVPPAKGSGSNVANPQMADMLADAILAAARDIKAAQTGAPALITSEVSAKIRFGISQDANGKVKLEFSPVSIGIDGATSAETAQEILVVYKRK